MEKSMTGALKPASRLQSKYVLLSLCVLLLFGLAWQWLHSHRPDTKAVAAAETHMWQAYYSGDLTRLHGELTLLLQAQFHIPPVTASQTAMQLSRAAMKFESSHGDYEQLVLPDLEAAYASIKAATKRDFDPKKAARAELAWWVSRRTPGQDSPQHVGQQIGELYAIIYGAERPEFTEAGVLRAEAGKLRDTGGADCDWKKVQTLLERSYATWASAL